VQQEELPTVEMELEEALERVEELETHEI